MINLNPGIRKTVQWLNENGFKTTDSGDGETHDFECDLDFPYVHIETSPEEMVDDALRLAGLLESKGVKFRTLHPENPGPTMQVTWVPREQAIISVFNVKDADLDWQQPPAATSVQPK